MARSNFDDLPAEALAKLRNLVGDFEEFTPAVAGNHAEIAGELRASQRRAFVKGVRIDPERASGGAEAWSLRNEAGVLPSVRPYAPELLWTTDVAEWRFVGFEVIDGRHADYTPGSADLELVAAAVDDLSGFVCPPSVRLRVDGRYKALDERAEPLTGASIVHTDLNPENVLIDAGGRVRFVDWAFVSRGAAWLDLAYMVPWMIRAGWGPNAAEMWMRQFPLWKGVEPDHVELFVSLLHKAWRPRAAAADVQPWVSEYFNLVHTWHYARGSE